MYRVVPHQALAALLYVVNAGSTTNGSTGSMGVSTGVSRNSTRAPATLASGDASPGTDSVTVRAASGGSNTGGSVSVSAGSSANSGGAVTIVSGGGLVITALLALFRLLLPPELTAVPFLWCPTAVSWARPVMCLCRMATLRAAMPVSEGASDGLLLGPGKGVMRSTGVVVAAGASAQGDGDSVHNQFWSWSIQQRQLGSCHRVCTS